MKIELYILDDNHQPIVVDLMAAAEWWAGQRGIVKQETVGRFWISTCFLPSLIAPPLFETMVFAGRGGRTAGYVRRTRTWEEAVEAHTRIVKLFARYDQALSYRERLEKNEKLSHQANHRG